VITVRVLPGMNVTDLKRLKSNIEGEKGTNKKKGSINNHEGLTNQTLQALVEYFLQNGNTYTEK
jgi:hypothetical protein